MAKSENIISFKTAYGAKSRVKQESVGESLTQQHFAHDADVRNIIKQYDKTGLIANVNRGVAKYGDYSEVNEYREALDFVISANDSFAELPSNIREMFGNDAGAFFEFATDPKNKEKMIELGLAAAPAGDPKEARMKEDSAAEPPAPQDEE